MITPRRKNRRAFVTQPAVRSHLIVFLPVVAHLILFTPVFCDSLRAVFPEYGKDKV